MLYLDFFYVIIEKFFINVKIYLYIICNYYFFFLKVVQYDGNVIKWYDVYFNKLRLYFINEGFFNFLCIEGKIKFSGNEEIYIIGVDNVCMIFGNEDKICNGSLKLKK